MQDAFASALGFWPVSGIPENPAAWITTTARRKLIDAARREQTRRDKQDSLLCESGRAIAGRDEDGRDELMDFPDDRLRLMFTCCHPALNSYAQVGLTLRTLGGLSTSEIARAFLISEPTLAQRLVRAKRKIQEARIPYEVSGPERLAERLAAVQAVLYLIFNEGYSASSGAELVREDLCAEGIRLARVLCELMPNNPESLGLLALMLLQHSHRDTRVRDGELVTLEEQDRPLWDQNTISEGLELVEKALKMGQVGPYQLQAAIAALHAQAATPQLTDWPQIAALYEKLLRINPTPVIALNHAVAIAMSGPLEIGLQLIDEMGETGALDQYYLFHAARADLLRRLSRKDEAASAYEDAAALATNPVEVAFLKRRLREVAVF